MAERAPKLSWRLSQGTSGMPDYYFAIVGPLDLSVRVPLRADNDHCWFVKREPNEGHPLRGTAPTLLAAQLAAEDAALAWLREGVEALGGKVLSAEQVAHVAIALRVGTTAVCVADNVECGSNRSCADCAAMLALAKELGE